MELLTVLSLLEKILVPLVNCYHHWSWLTLNLFISELLVTSESVKHRMKSVYYYPTVFLTIFEFGKLIHV